MAETRLIHRIAELGPAPGPAVWPALSPAVGPAVTPARGPRAVVMTMGALHAGHISLVEEARRQVGADGQVVVTIFVNPLQFGDPADLERYPKTLEADVDACMAAGVDVVFAPSGSEVYPQGPPDVRVDAGPLGDKWEGAVRPGHFSGMLTVVLKLLNIVRPDVAIFGEKDYQQLVLIRRMVTDLNVPVRIVGVPTARDADGLALSSRNRFLTAAERARALSISRALVQARGMAEDPGRPATVEELVAHVNEQLAAAEIEPDYVLGLSNEMGPAPRSGSVRLLVAAQVGSVHLLDNIGAELRS